MGKECFVCGKKPQPSWNVSKSNRHTKRRLLPNLQRIKARIHNTVRRITVCTRCLKANKILKA